MNRVTRTDSCTRWRHCTVKDACSSTILGDKKLQVFLRVWALLCLFCMKMRQALKGDASPSWAPVCIINVSAHQQIGARKGITWWSEREGASSSSQSAPLCICRRVFRDIVPSSLFGLSPFWTSYSRSWERKWSPASPTCLIWKRSLNSQSTKTKPH